jgi:hypothetical protein
MLPQIADYPIDHLERTTREEILRRIEQYLHLSQKSHYEYRCNLYG